MALLPLLGLGWPTDHFGQGKDGYWDCRLARRSGKQEVLFQVNGTGLSGYEVSMLQGMQINMVATDKAVVDYSGGASASGNLTAGVSSNGLTQGAMSLQIPGVDYPVEGSWVTVNVTSAAEKTRKAFEKTTKKVASDLPVLELMGLVTAVGLLSSGGQ